MKKVSIEKNHSSPFKGGAHQHRQEGQSAGDVIKRGGKKRVNRGKKGLQRTMNAKRGWGKIDVCLR